MPEFNAIVTSMRDLVDEIDTFLTVTLTNTWTQDSAPTGAGSGDAAWSTGDCFVQVEWSSDSLLTIHQSLGFSAPNNPGSESGDSNFPSELDLFGVSISSAEVWGFANDTATATDRYFYLVVEFNRDGRFAHGPGFGHLEKLYGNWTGGAFKYGWQWDNAATAAQRPWAQGHRLLLDSNHGLVTSSSNLATIRASSMPFQGASGDWLAFTDSDSNVTQTDENGNPIDKADGWSRIGPWPHTFLHLRGNPNNAFIPLVPIQVNYRPNSGDNRRYPLGRMRDVRVCNIGNIAPRDSITLGSNTWRFFPWGQKLTDPGSGIIGSRNAGVAYRVT